MIKVAFSASGYGTKIEKYKTTEEAVAAIEREAGELAGDRGLDPNESVSRWKSEWVLSSSSGEDIARWEIYE